MLFPKLSFGYQPKQKNSAAKTRQIIIQMMDQRIILTLHCTRMLKCESEPMNFLLRVTPRKENGRPHKAKKKASTSAGIEPTTSGRFDQLLFY